MKNGNDAPKEAQQLNIELTEEVAEGVYSNLVMLAHSSEEFILDFILGVPPQGALASRVIISPSHAKRIIAALQDNVQKYEEKFGKIEAGQGPEERIGFTQK